MKVTLQSHASKPTAAPAMVWFIYFDPQLERILCRRYV
jgi:hypothetical protein